MVELSAGGARVSPVVAGAWRMDSWGWSPAERLRWIQQCVDLGVTSFDHADIYGGYTVEALFGEALALQPALRERIQLVSKCGIKLVSPARPGHRIKSYDTSAAHIVASVEQSLAALRTDRLDLLLIHRPDALMDAAEIAHTVQRLRREGKVLHFGVSNFTPSQFALLDAATPLATNQIELHPLQLAPLHDGTLDQAQALGRRPMIWSPLAGGRLLAGEDTAALRVRRVLQAVGERLGCPAATVAYAWLLRHPARPVPVAGSRRIEGLREAVAALDVRLDAQTWYEIWQAGQGQEVP
ncbi:aldo/keto reductase [Ideonella sp. BN130291]|uniref:aldo/keto reductase n=1 Tax=Ideonella sp. BN130291 TaxID=3112940 RepID=UPI002E25919E|nr:aldo/keto reductase [Ideonella sp. BN130291]